MSHHAAAAPGTVTLSGLAAGMRHSVWLGGREARTFCSVRDEGDGPEPLMPWRVEVGAWWRRQKTSPPRPVLVGSVTFRTAAVEMLVGLSWF